MLQHRSLITESTWLTALPQLETLRQRFQAAAVDWLPAWYRSYALAEAVAPGHRRDPLSLEGLQAFKMEVEQLAMQAPRVVDHFLNDDIWWHYDQDMDEAAVIYSIRLCMGRIALPLTRAGFYLYGEWRERVTVLTETVADERNDAGGPIFHVHARHYRVPTRRWFYSAGTEKNQRYPDEFPVEMTRLLGAYFQRVKWAQDSAYSERKRQEEHATHQREAEVNNVLGFRTVRREPMKQPFRLPSAPEE